MNNIKYSKIISKCTLHGRRILATQDGYGHLAPCLGANPFLRVSTTVSPMHAKFAHISPCLKGGDGVGCTRANKYGIDGMTGLHAENIEHW